MNAIISNRPASRPRPHGFTLLEIMIGTLVFAVVMGGMYSFLKQANTASSKSYTRQDLVNQSNTILKVMQDDFRMAASAAISLTDTQSEIKITQRMNDGDSVVTYKWNKPKLVRKAVFGGKTTIHQFSDNLETFSVEKKLRPVTDENDMTKVENEQVVIRLALTAPVAGNTKPMTIEQHAMATMRDVASAKYDPHWRDVGNMKGAFDAYGNLLDSLTADADLLLEDISASTEKLVDDVENFAKDSLNQNVNNLKEAKTNIQSALKDIAKGKLDLKTSLDDMENNMKSMPNDIFQREAKKPGTWFGSKSDAKKRVTDAYMAMKTVEDCDVSKLERAAKPFKLNDAFRQMVKSKKEALENKVKMEGNETKLNGLLGDVDKKISETGG